MGASPALPRKVAEVLKKYGWDIEYFKGFILGLVWLDLYRENSRYEAFLDVAEGALSAQEHLLLEQYASQVCDDIEMERYKFSAGCKVDEKNLAANYRNEHKLFQWARGVYMACRIIEVMREDGDIEQEANAYITDRIAETVFPFLDKKFAIDFFSELNERPMPARECAQLLGRLRTDLPRMIRDLTLSSQMINQSQGFDEYDDDDDDEELSGPVGNIHSYFAGLTDIMAINDRIDHLLPRVMEGERASRLKNMEALVRYAEKALGAEFIEQNKGFFLGVLETRTYMRALAAMAEPYKAAMQREKAVACYERSLKLCNNDNLGAAFLLADLYIELRRVDDALALIARFNDDGAMILFTKALALFIKLGDSKEATKALKAAIKANPFIVPMLLGAIPMPQDPPSYYSPGDEHEAVIYVTENRLLWRNTPGALGWLIKK